MSAAFYASGLVTDYCTGHASTTGIPTIDYYITYKLFELPSAQEFYSEKLVTFSDFSPYYKVDVSAVKEAVDVTYFRFAQPATPDNIPERSDLFERWGITHRIHANTTIYVCHQTIFKLIPNFDEVFRFVLWYACPTGA